MTIAKDWRTISLAPGESRAPTFFAPGERYSADEIKAGIKSIIDDPVVKVILGTIPGSVLLLNSERQILAGNRKILDALGLSESDPIMALRPGEALSCVHSGEGPSGCGTSVSCKSCGAVLTMLAALDEGKPVQGECAISARAAGKFACLNLDFYAAPLDIGGMRCLEVVFHDVSRQKMRELLDRLFFHDLRNSLSGLVGWSELYAMDEENREGKGISPDILFKIAREMSKMLDEHTEVLAAESGELKVKRKCVTVGCIAESLAGQLSVSSTSARNRLKFLHDMERSPETVSTDPTLLNRVLLNMVKNAFEATGGRETVTVAHGRDETGMPFFSVHNPGHIPEEIKPKIFQRAFSTKGGNGRGLGTYGMKLFGENWLNGRVSFESSPEEGTTFRISLPN